ncbi:unnamed protein product [Acanthoscelides obtectus]|uniref:DUF4780 domain-containing protein n=1 Tax=Acanthoscelides obtectus TaxID=200917 RepID=A0A9P0JLC4_ACAOB|nr:unnamed protein product [Acanthoscelides obtectus]CAK1673765.1 hypothetical protein AOBTE_LOCUS29432 [Acanthoscelides obtectus]
MEKKDKITNNMDSSQGPNQNIAKPSGGEVEDKTKLSGARRRRLRRILNSGIPYEFAVQMAYEEEKEEAEERQMNANSSLSAEVSRRGSKSYKHVHKSENLKTNNLSSAKKKKQEEMDEATGSDIKKWRYMSGTGRIQNSKDIPNRKGDWRAGSSVHIKEYKAPFIHSRSFAESSAWIGETKRSIMGDQTHPWKFNDNLKFKTTTVARGCKRTFKKDNSDYRESNSKRSNLAIGEHSHQSPNFKFGASAIKNPKDKIYLPVKSPKSHMQSNDVLTFKECEEVKLTGSTQIDLKKLVACGVPYKTTKEKVLKDKAQMKSTGQKNSSMELSGSSNPRASQVKYHSTSPSDSSISKQNIKKGTRWSNNDGQAIEYSLNKSNFKVGNSKSLLLTDNSFGQILNKWQKHPSAALASSSSSTFIPNMKSRKDLKSLYVAGLLHPEYPTSIFTRDQLLTLKEAVVEAVTYIPDNIPQEKMHCILRYGWLQITCADEASLNSLEGVTKNLQSYGMLEFVKGKDLPNPHVCEAFLHDDAEGEHLIAQDVLKRLERMNDGLDTQTWIVLDHIISGPGQIWTFAIDEMSLQTLTRESFRLYFGYDKVQFHLKSMVEETIDLSDETSSNMSINSTTGSNSKDVSTPEGTLLMKDSYTMKFEKSSPHMPRNSAAVISCSNANIGNIPGSASQMGFASTTKYGMSSLPYMPVNSATFIPGGYFGSGNNPGGTSQMKYFSNSNYGMSSLPYMPGSTAAFIPGGYFGSGNNPWVTSQMEYFSTTKCGMGSPYMPRNSAAVKPGSNFGSGNTPACTLTKKDSSTTKYGKSSAKDMNPF